jgi:cobalt transport protein ATP-binding subunit
VVDKEKVNHGPDTWAVDITGLSFRYRHDQEALRDINLRIRQGERLAVIGPNGAGKSTLLMHLNGILRGTGSVRICGMPVSGKSIPEIRAKVGLVFQDPDDQLFCPTVFEDVAFGPMNLGFRKEEILERVNTALEQVGLADCRDRSAFHLSGGEKKRVALATVLALDPEILALDEPSVNIDPRHRRRLLNWLKAFSKTLVIATHDLDFALTICDRCVLLNVGRVVADGPSRKILRDRELLEANDLELPLCLQGPPDRER